MYLFIITIFAIVKLSMENLEKRVTELENTISTLLQHIQNVNHSIANGFEKVEKHFEDVDKNFAIINRNIDLIKGNSTASLETVENSIVNLTTEISKINDTSGYKDLYANMKVVRKL